VCADIRENLINRNWTRFKSFGLVRDGNIVSAFISGKEYFDALIPALLNARFRVCIAGWYLSPGLYLERDTVHKRKRKLERLLKKVASRGVKVYILIWNALAMKLNSDYVCRKLNKHENIFIMSHRPKFSKLSWCHHQKFVIVDDRTSFLGGIDLGYGRYDDHEYSLVDPQGVKFPGADYTNLNLIGEKAGPTHMVCIDRATDPRLPWHDLHCMIDGPATKDVLRNFIERWNFVYTEHKSDWPKSHLIFPVREIPEFPEKEIGIKKKRKLKVLPKNIDVHASFSDHLILGEVLQVKKEAFIKPTNISF